MVSFPPLHVSCPLGFSSWGCRGGIGFSPQRARCGGDATAWVAEVLAARGTQGSWKLGKQEIQCSRKVWQRVLANPLQYSCLENPFSDREAWQVTVYRVSKNWTRPKWLCMHIYKTFFACGSSAPVRGKHENGTAAWLTGILAVPSLQGNGLPPPQELWPCCCCCC